MGMSRAAPIGLRAVSRAVCSERVGVASFIARAELLARTAGGGAMWVETRLDM
jgi:hypothetical protein